MKLNKKIRMIRITERLTQKDFTQLIGVKHDSGIRIIENRRHEVGSAKIERLCNKFPQYALWLVTDGIDICKIKNQIPTNNLGETR